MNQNGVTHNPVCVGRILLIELQGKTNDDSSLRPKFTCKGESELRMRIGVYFEI